MNNVDELISASLSNDLTDAEREQMDAHLARCERCRDTLAAFADQRRLISGMRHVAVPRDLAPRIRTGIEAGRRPGLAWWRRPGGVLAIAASVTTAAVAVLLAVLIFKPNSNVSVLSSPTSTASALPTPSAIPTESVVPTATPTAPPSVQPTPTVIPVPPDQPAGYFSYVVKDQTATMSFVRGDGTATTIDLPKYGQPADATLSPDGSMLAFRVDGDLSGLSDFYALNLEDGTLTSLGASMQPIYGLGNELAWAPDSAYLAYTLTTQDSKSDVWLFSTAERSAQQLTNTGDSYSSSWMTYLGGRELLWISRAADRPVSYLLNVYGEGVPAFPLNPTDPAVNAGTADDVFEPLISPDGKHVIFWRGTMGTPGGHWSFSEGGMPWLADVSYAGKDVQFTNARQVFSSLTGGREMFRGASITWGPDSDAFAVWNAQWTGIPQGERFPDSTRVYFGHVSNEELITAAETLDAPDTQGATVVVDVALAADGNHLGLTVQTAPGAEGGAYGPSAELRLITRGYGTDPDKVEVIGQGQTWSGPAVYANIVQIP
jgi:hypothetical protein